MQSFAKIMSLSYLKSHAEQISEDVKLNGNPFVINYQKRQSEHGD